MSSRNDNSTKPPTLEDGGDASSVDATKTIAIVGMGCRWPGGVRDSSALWELLRNKRSGFREFGDHRFSLDGFYHPETSHPGTAATRGAFLLEEDARLFDPSFFGIQPLEVETMDASQRKLLEVIYEAFENAGDTWENVSGSRTGVFVGNFTTEHTVIQSRDPDHPRPYVTTGSSLSLLSNRISYIFNLSGPSVTLDTACSSSLYALHLAVRAIESGDCDSAIVAASNWIMDPTMQIMMNKLGALSNTSACHTFDASADGYARGEGFAALYLKKGSAAIDDGSPIRAFVRGTAVNANGRTGGITHPSKAGQEAVIRAAYRNAGNLPFRDTTYFECHGTGTPVGDPVEVAAIGNVFASAKSMDKPLYLGSIKTNLGHTESASAIAGIMKVVLALEAGVIPPSIGIEKLNPAIDFDKAKVEVLTELTHWPKGALRRASINSFGYGGANGHCIIDHVNNVLPGYVKPGIVVPFVPRYSNDHAMNGNPSNGYSTNGHATNGHATNGHATNGHGSNGHRPAENGASSFHVPRPFPAHSPMVRPLKKTRRTDAKHRPLVLLPFSAHNMESLNLNMTALFQVLDRFPLGDVAYTLASKRSRFAFRSFRIGEESNLPVSVANEQPVLTSPAEIARLALVFTGQGAQWHAMGRQLFQYRVFARTIAYLEHVLASLPFSDSAWTISEILMGDLSNGRINEPAISQTVCTALQVGLVDLLASWSIRPTSVVGHSSGEIAAAYASGRLTAAEAICVAFCRGCAVAQNERDGSMLAVGLGAQAVQTYTREYEDQVKIAAINSPGSVTLSGDSTAVEIVASKLTEANVFNRSLKTGGNAYHSHHMRPLGQKYAEYLSCALEICKKRDLVNSQQLYPKIPWSSSVTPDKAIGQLVDPSYWIANLVSPVRFASAVENLVQAEKTSISVFVEIGPHAALKGPVDQSLKGLGLSLPYTTALTRGKDGQECLLQLCGTLFGLNAPVDLVAVNSVDGEEEYGHGSTTIDLPPYQFAYGPVSYHESRISKEYRARRIAHHDLIGSKIAGSAKLRPQWRNILRVDHVGWLGDHRLLPDAILPAAAYVAMAIESASQAYCELKDPLQVTGFSLRNLSIKSALKIPEDDRGVEVILSLELSDAASAKSPCWATFSISSVTSDTQLWTEHCTGSVKVQVSDPPSIQKMSGTMDARVVNAQAWYSKFANIGLGYGPSFQGLSDIESDPAQSWASAKLDLKTTSHVTKTHESKYALHPASLDALFQLGLIACHGGQLDKAATAYVPVHIDELYIKNGNQQSWGVGHACGELRGLRGAYAKIQLHDQEGNVVTTLNSLRCVSYGDSSLSADNTKHHIRPFACPLSRLVWKPDVRVLSSEKAQGLFPPPQENVDRADLFHTIHTIATIIVIDIHERYGGMSALTERSGDQIRYFLAWVGRRCNQDNTEAMQKAKSLSSQERQKWLDDLYAPTGDLIEVRIARQLHKNMEDILYERRTGVEVLVHEGLLTALYENGLAMTGAYPQLERLMDIMGHANPHQKILELGAGTGGATRVAMKTLTDCASPALKRYSQYTFTDVSPGFLTAAKEFMAPFYDIDYSVLDIERDPVEQGHDTDYDVVIASQCLHATPNIAKTLANVRRLLKPGGKLVLVENTQNAIGHGLVLGTLTGYWDGVPDGRVDSPFLDLQSWDKALREAGFSGLEIVLEDYPRPHNTASTIMSTLLEKADQSLEQRLTPEIVLLHVADKEPSLLQRLAEELKGQSVRLTVKHLQSAKEVVRGGSRVIVFLDDGSFLIDSDAERLSLFQHLARSVSSMVWITSGGILRGSNPDAALATGLLRTLGTENAASRFLSIDVEPHIQDSKQEVQGLVRFITTKELELQEPASEDADDREYVWQDGAAWVSRVAPDTHLSNQMNLISTSAERAESKPIGSQGPIRAAFETPGILTSLFFQPYTELMAPLPATWIEVKVAAVGLNWKDLGVSSGRFDANNLSSEYSGVITKVGSDVDTSQLAVGDLVYGMGRGHFGNYTRVPSDFAHKLEPNENLVEVATMPLVYMTAVYAFDHVTVLKKNEKVLIQSATGGLGLAAIQLSRARGAEVFVMVGNDDKAHFLRDEMYIPETHIFKSQDMVDMDRILARVGGRGFDVILSTGRDDSFHNSFKALAPLGRLIDVGRMDVLDSKDLALGLFQKGITFASFDLGLILESSPEVGSQLIQAVDRYYRAGDIGPIRPFTVSDISQLDQVLLGFSKGTHLGKLVVSFQDPNALVRVVQSAPMAAQFDPEARYIITGGLGGLGRATIRWMAERGARDIVVLSRSGATALEAQELLRDLGSRGITIKAMRCNIGSREQVVKVIKDVSAGRIIKGVIHAAMSLQDGSFDRLTIEKWRESLTAKVHGTKYLHEALDGQQLDFFVMTTSLESVIALATQSAYTAANNFQEVFARYRRSLGLPASTVSYGLIHDVGALSRSSTTLNMMERNKTLSVSEYEFLRSLELAFAGSRTTASISDVTTKSLDPLSCTGFITCLDPAGLAVKKRQSEDGADGAATYNPRWYSDGRVSMIMRGFDDAYRHAKGGHGHDDDPRGNASSVVEKLLEDFNKSIKDGLDGRGQTQTLVIQAIIATIAGMLSIDASGISASKSVADYGVDSLIAAELQNWFNLVFRISITMLDLLDTHNSIEKLAEMVVFNGLERQQKE
ncbi:hypothetical protein G7054_g2978 [Neopestalotiopsis clavispora]|nr:hypothetical protein G7054_g2978 [Neopestalotiopsis clavispora]